MPKLSRVLDISDAAARRILESVQDLCVAQGGGRPPYRDILPLFVEALEPPMDRAAGPLFPSDGRSVGVIVRREFVSGTARNEPRRPTSRAPLVLESKRGTRRLSVERRPCADCGLGFKTLWEYAKTSRGRVLICSRCKAKAQDRSYRYVDASEVLADSRFLNHDHRDGKQEGFRTR